MDLAVRWMSCCPASVPCAVAAAVITFPVKSRTLPLSAALPGRLVTDPLCRCGYFSPLCVAQPLTVLATRNISSALLMTLRRSSMPISPVSVDWLLPGLLCIQLAPGEFVIVVVVVMTSPLNLPIHAATWLSNCSTQSRPSLVMGWASDKVPNPAL